MIAESRLDPSILWVGTADGILQVTRDLGQTWTNVVGNNRDAPEGWPVSSIEPSRRQPGRVVVGFLVGGRIARYFESANYGRNWEEISR